MDEQLSSLKDLLKVFNDKKLTPEQQKVLEKKSQILKGAINDVYSTANGAIVIQALFDFSRFWELLPTQGAGTRIAQQELLKQTILCRLSDNNLADLINKTRKE